MVIEETEFKCPECSEKILKYYARVDNHRTQSWVYKWFHCPNKCELGCKNCVYSNSHGECDLDFCMGINKWKPETKRDDYD